MDNGGWASLGSIPKTAKCPKCSNDCARMLEFVTKIYGASSRNRYVFCNVCGQESEFPSESISDK